MRLKKARRRRIDSWAGRPWSWILCPRLLDRHYRSREPCCDRVRIPSALIRDRRGPEGNWRRLNWARDRDGRLCACFCHCGRGGCRFLIN